MLSESNYKMYLCMLSVVLENNELWYSAGCINGIFKTNLSTEKTDLVTNFQQSYVYEYRMFDIAVSVKDKMFFLPFNSNKLAVYEKISQEIKYIKLFDNNINSRIGTGFVFHEYVVMIPCDKNMPLIMYHYKSNEIYKISDFLNFIENEVIYDTYIFAQGYHVYSDKLYLAIQGTQILVQIDLNKKRSEIIKIGCQTEKKNHIHAMTGNGEILYLIDESGKMIIWDVEKHKIESYKMFNSKFIKGKIEVQSVVPSAHNIWIFLWGVEKIADTILKYDCMSNKTQEIHVKKSSHLTGGLDRKSYGYLFAQYLKEDVIIAGFINSSQLLYIDERKKELRTINLEFENEEYIKRILKRKTVSEEVFQDGIHLFCKNVLMHTSQKRNAKEQNVYGKKILETIIL